MIWKMSSPLLFLSRKLEWLRKWECVLGSDGEGEDGVLTLSDVQIKAKERQLPRAYARICMHCAKLPSW